METAIIHVKSVIIDHYLAKAFKTTCRIAKLSALLIEMAKSKTLDIEAKFFD